MVKLSDKPLGELVNTVGLDAAGNVRTWPTALCTERIPQMEFPRNLGRFRTAGYFFEGDGGGATFERVSTGGQRISKYGAHWALRERSLNVRMFGAKGDGSDDTSAL